MGSKHEEKLSRFLSLVLRHDPAAAGITVNKKGAWADVEELLRGVNASGLTIDRALLEKIVREDRKGRYSFSADRRYIRANQGHSLDVDLGFEPVAPPDVLYHGTATKSLDGIRTEGITKRTRQYVHLSRDLETAFMVGGRHGKPVVLVIDAAAMARDGKAFYLSENGVWLRPHVPWEYVTDMRYHH